MRRMLVTLSLLAVGGGVACDRVAGSAQGSNQPGQGTVVRVVDGDTLHVRIGRSDVTVRLIGIDTPETHKPDSPIECFGVEAAKALGTMIPAGTPVRLERDAEARDRYGRLLAYVYRDSDHAFVNLEMARAGYADAFTYPPNVAHSDEFVAAAADARDSGRGLWSACGGGHVTLTR